MPKKVVYKPAEKVKPIYPGGTIRPPDYRPTLLEWLATKGQQIMENALVLNTKVVLYTVPKDSILYITSASISVVHFGGAAADREAFLYAGTNVLQTTNKFLYIGLRGVDLTNSMATSFSTPIKLHSGNVVGCFSDANLYAHACFQGFVVRNSDIPL